MFAAILPAVVVQPAPRAADGGLMPGGLLGLLIWLIIAAVVITVLVYVLPMLRIPDTLQRLVLLIVGAILLILLLIKLFAIL